MSIPKLLKSDTFLVNQTGLRSRDATKFLGSTFTQRVVKNLPTSVLRVYVPPPAPLWSNLTNSQDIGVSPVCLPPGHTFEFYNDGPNPIATGISQNDCTISDYGTSTIVFNNLSSPVEWYSQNLCIDTTNGKEYINLPVTVLLGSSSALVWLIG